MYVRFDEEMEGLVYAVNEVSEMNHKSIDRSQK
jgi:hypothetical protein